MTERLRAIVDVATRFAVTGLVIAFVLFVWPTRYRYDRLQMLGETASGPIYPVRIDRFTGAAEILLPQMLLDSRHNMQLAWVGMDGDPLPDDVLAALRGNILIDTKPLPYAQILNTTEWRITKVRWNVTSPAGAGTQGSAPPVRVLDQSVFIEPHSVASLYLDLGRFGHEASITFQTAWGVPAPGR